MLNNWTGMGRFTKDPELRTTQNGKPVVTFTIAVDRDYDRETADFFTCVAWNQKAEFINNHYKKGQLAVVNGAFQSRAWKDRDGNNRVSWEVNVVNIYFAEKKAQTADVAVEELGEEELPF